MAADDMGDFERAGMSAGFGALVSASWAVPEAIVAAGERPVLMLPQCWVEQGWRDQAYAVGLAEVFLRRYGFAALVRVLMHLDEAAEFFAAVEGDRESAAD